MVLRGARWHSSVLAWVLGGCGGQSVATEPERGSDREPTACGGAIRSEPMVLASGLSLGRLHARSDELVLVENEGRVLRINPCTGDAVELASGLGSIASSALGRDGVWILTSLDSARTLVHVALEGTGIGSVLRRSTPSTKSSRRHCADSRG